MSSEAVLSTEEVIAGARRSGIEISERTIKYYVSLGLLPRPGRHPSEHVDRRVLFFPPEVLGTLERIRDLKDSGLTLEQIRRVLSGEARPDLEALAAAPEPPAPRLAEKVVQALASDEVREAYREYTALAADASDEELRSLARDFYRRVLTALVGPEEAERTVAQAFARLTPAQWERRLAPLRTLRDNTGGSVLGRTLTSHLRELGRRILAGEPAESLQPELEAVRARVETLSEKYRAVPASNPQKHEIARFMSRALEVYAEAVWLLGEGARTSDRTTVEGAISRAQRAGEILGHLENMIAEKRELLRLCQEEELRIP